MGKQAVFVPARFLVMPYGIIIGTLYEFMNKVYDQRRQKSPAFNDIFIHGDFGVFWLTIHSCFLLCDNQKKLTNSGKLAKYLQFLYFFKQLQSYSSRIFTHE